MMRRKILFFSFFANVSLTLLVSNPVLYKTLSTVFPSSESPRGNFTQGCALDAFQLLVRLRKTAGKDFFSSHYALNIGAGDGWDEGQDPLYQAFNKLGFRGLALEADESKDQALRQSLAKNKLVSVETGTLLTKHNILGILEKHQVPKTLDVLKIDIDSVDCEILGTILIRGQYRPKLIFFEIDHETPLPLRSATQNTFQQSSKDTLFYGCSLGALMDIVRGPVAKRFLTGNRSEESKDFAYHYDVVASGSMHELILMDRGLNERKDRSGEEFSTEEMLLLSDSDSSSSASSSSASLQNPLLSFISKHAVAFGFDAVTELVERFLLLSTPRIKVRLEGEEESSFLEIPLSALESSILIDSPQLYKAALTESSFQKSMKPDFKTPSRIELSTSSVALEKKSLPKNSFLVSPIPWANVLGCVGQQFVMSRRGRSNALKNAISEASVGNRVAALIQLERAVQAWRAVQDLEKSSNPSHHSLSYTDSFSEVRLNLSALSAVAPTRSLRWSTANPVLTADRYVEVYAAEDAGLRDAIYNERLAGRLSFEADSEAFYRNF